MQGYAGKYISKMGEGHISIWPHAYSAVVAGTWATAMNALQIMYGYFYNSSNANLNEVDYKIFLDGGTYTFRVCCYTATNGAIMDVLLDTVSKGTIDTYSAAPTYNVLKSITGIVVTTPGIKTLGIKVNGRNASNVTGYYVIFSTLALWRTA